MDPEVFIMFVQSITLAELDRAGGLVALSESEQQKLISRSLDFAERSSVELIRRQLAAVKAAEQASVPTAIEPKTLEYKLRRPQ